MARKSLIMQLALATIIGMPMVAIIIDRFSETVDLRSAIIGNGIFWQQLLYGVISGLVIGILAQLLISSPLLSQINLRYANVLGRFKLTYSEILFVSLCAGVGEEILFRGAFQPLFGIVFTSVFFVAIHGYLSPRNWRLSIYGLYMAGAICYIGYISETQGLIAAIVSHTVIDIYLILHLQKIAGQITISDNPDLTDDKEQSEETY